MQSSAILIAPIIEPTRTIRRKQYYTPSCMGFSLVLHYLYDCLTLQKEHKSLEAHCTQLEFVTYGLYLWLYHLLRVSNESEPLTVNTKLYFDRLHTLLYNVQIPEFMSTILSEIGAFKHDYTHADIYARFPEMDPTPANRAFGIYNLDTSHCLPNFQALFRAISHQLNARAWNLNFTDSTAAAAPAPVPPVQTEYWKLPGLARTPRMPIRPRIQLGTGHIPPFLAAANVNSITDILALPITWLQTMTVTWHETVKHYAKTVEISSLTTTSSNSALIRVTDAANVATPGPDDDRFHVQALTSDFIQGVPFTNAIGFFPHYHPSANYLYNGNPATAPGQTRLSINFPVYNNFSTHVLYPMDQYPKYCFLNTK